MKVTFLISFNQTTVGGLFLSATTRIRYFVLNNNEIEVDIFNIRLKPPFFIRILKSLIKGHYAYPADCNLNGLKVKNVYLPINSWEYIKNRFLKSFELDYKGRIDKISEYFTDTDLIAAHFGNGPGEIALYLSEKLGKKFSVTFHGSDINITPFINKKKHRLFVKMLRQSSANIFLSKGLMETASKIYDSKEKSHILYNGIDFDLFRPYDEFVKESFKINLELNRIVIGFVGNLVAVKNVFTLAKIFSRIKENESDVSFIIIGDGDLKKYLQKSLSENKIKCFMIDQIPNREMPMYYNAMDVLVLPSKSEGLPRVILEALACGVNCVGSKIGGICELLPEENTFDLNSNFETRISNRIIELINSKGKPLIIKELFDLNRIARLQGDIFRAIFE